MKDWDFEFQFLEKTIQYSQDIGYVIIYRVDLHTLPFLRQPFFTGGFTPTPCPGSRSGRQVMAAQLKEIVDRLNAEPFNLDLSLLVFDEKDRKEIYMGVNPKIGGNLPPKSWILIGFEPLFSPSILGYPYFWKHPYIFIDIYVISLLQLYIYDCFWFVFFFSYDFLIFMDKLMVILMELYWQLMLIIYIYNILMELYWWLLILTVIDGYRFGRLVFTPGAMPHSGWEVRHMAKSPRGITHLKFNSSPLKSYRPKRKIVFQPSIFRGELLNFGGVIQTDDQSGGTVERWNQEKDKMTLDGWPVYPPGLRMLH